MPRARFRLEEAIIAHKTHNSVLDPRRQGRAVATLKKSPATAGPQLVCLRTGDRIEFSSGELIEWRDAICKEHGWDPVGHRVVIFALSPEE